MATLSLASQPKFRPKSVWKNSFVAYLEPMLSEDKKKKEVLQAAREGVRVHKKEFLSRTWQPSHQKKYRTAGPCRDDVRR